MPEESYALDRVALSEIGYTGLNLSAGIPQDEIKRDLQFPTSIKTFKQMTYDATIAAAIAYGESMMLKSKFKFKPHDMADDAQKEYATFMTDAIEDMEHSWQDFIQEVSSMAVYGFSIHEIVLRKRLKKKGSKYNDGKIGIRKLPIRSQDSIKKWDYDQNKQELKGVYQTAPQSTGAGFSYTKMEEIYIPRNKFLLFRLGRKKDSPLGESPLKGCYYAWRYKLTVEEQEAVGLQRDLTGIPHAEVPPEIMSDDASPEAKLQYEQWKNIVRNIHQNRQSGLVTPLAYDQETKMPLYKFSLLKNDSGKAYDTTKIKDYYVNSILTALGADVLILGQGATGSYALGTLKGTMAATMIEARLQEVCNVFNNYLIPLIGEYNGWELTRLPTLIASDLESVELEGLSKYLQRTASVGLLPITHEVINKVLDGIGLPPLPDDANLDELLPEKTSRSGDGMATAGDGTSTDPLNIDSNDNNVDNVG